MKRCSDKIQKAPLSLFPAPWNWLKEVCDKALSAGLRAQVCNWTGTIPRFWHQKAQWKKKGLAKNTG